MIILFSIFRVEGSNSLWLFQKLFPRVCVLDYKAENISPMCYINIDKWMSWCIVDVSQQTDGRPSIFCVGSKHLCYAIDHWQFIGCWLVALMWHLTLIGAVGAGVAANRSAWVHGAQCLHRVWTAARVPVHERHRTEDTLRGHRQEWLLHCRRLFCHLREDLKRGPFGAFLMLFTHLGTTLSNFWLNPWNISENMNERLL